MEGQQHHDTLMSIPITPVSGAPRLNCWSTDDSDLVAYKLWSTSNDGTGRLSGFSSLWGERSLWLCLPSWRSEWAGRPVHLAVPSKALRHQPGFQIVWAGPSASPCMSPLSSSSFPPWQLLSWGEWNRPQLLLQPPWTWKSWPRMAGQNRTTTAVMMWQSSWSSVAIGGLTWCPPLCSSPLF